jgi:hypothetical protein
VVVVPPQTLQPAALVAAAASPILELPRSPVVRPPRVKGSLAALVSDLEWVAAVVLVLLVKTPTWRARTLAAAAALVSQAQSLALRLREPEVAVAKAGACIMPPVGLAAAELAERAQLQLGALRARPTLVAAAVVHGLR